MKKTVFFFVFTSCVYLFASSQVFVVPMIQENMKVHLLTDHDANHIETNMAIWGQQGHIMSVILANNSVLLSDYLTLSMSSYKLEVEQEMDDPNTMLAENVEGFTDVTIQRGQKWVVDISTLTSPEVLSRTHSISITSDQGVLGFVLIGDNDRQQLGGYLGIPVPLN